MGIYKIYIHINRYIKLLIKLRKKLKKYAINFVFFEILLRNIKKELKNS